MALVVLLVPALALLTAAQVAALGVAGDWPSVETPAPLGPEPVFEGCDGNRDRLTALHFLARSLDDRAVLAATGPGEVPDEESLVALEGSEGVQEGLDRLLACGGLSLGLFELAGGPQGRTTLTAVGRARTLRAWAHSARGDHAGASRDLASALRYSALLEHSGAELALIETGLRIGHEALDGIETWLDAYPDAPIEALAPLQSELDAQVDLPLGSLAGLAWVCRLQEQELLDLATLAPPEPRLREAGMPLWATWLADRLPASRAYDAPRTLAMHRQRCSRRLQAVREGGGWGQVQLDEPLWDPQQGGLGRMLDNPLGRVVLGQSEDSSQLERTVDLERSLQTRRALVRVRVALEIGARQHQGQLPSHLQLLVPELLPSLPTDPVDGQPINWVRSHGEIFTTRRIMDGQGDLVPLVAKLPIRQE